MSPHPRTSWARSLLAALFLLPATASAESDTGRYIVKFKDVPRGQAALAAAGARVKKELGPQRAAAVELPAAALEALRKNESVEYVEEDVLRKPLAENMPYGIPMVQADQVWSLSTGANRKVCIIDSGFHLGHEDLQTGNITGYPSGWDTDGCGHGTHVAGTIAAYYDNGTGVAGVLPNGVALHIVKVFGDDCGWSYASDLVDALNRCQSAGAHVVSMSLGGSRSSRTEETAFANAYSNGVLPIAAAGNDGTTGYSYPASYSSVVSVAALDSNKVKASFSQYNDQVEVAAPGVAVLSTVPWKETNSLTTNGLTYSGGYITHAARSSGVSGTLVDGGLCDSPGSWSGQVVLCQRGSISFYDKVMNVQSSGGAAALIYNNVSGGFLGTLGDGNSSTIPALSLSMEDGQELVAGALGLSGTVVSQNTKPDSGYEAWDGTSMATPHVSAVAALIWSYDTRWSNEQVRTALQATAEDLGAAGRDNEYGYGLVQARAALDYLINGGGGGGGGGGGLTLSASGYKQRGTRKADLSWSGATSTQVDVYRNGSKVITTTNDGTYTESLGRGRGGSYTYKVCEASTTTCSNEASVSF